MRSHALAAVLLLMAGCVGAEPQSTPDDDTTTAPQPTASEQGPADGDGECPAPEQVGAWQTCGKTSHGMALQYKSCVQHQIDIALPADQVQPLLPKGYSPIAFVTVNGMSPLAATVQLSIRDCKAWMLGNESHEQTLRFYDLLAMVSAPSNAVDASGDAYDAYLLEFGFSKNQHAALFEHLTGLGFPVVDVEIDPGRPMADVPLYVPVVRAAGVVRYQAPTVDATTIVQATRWDLRAHHQPSGQAHIWIDDSQTGGPVSVAAASVHIGGGPLAAISPVASGVVWLHTDPVFGRGAPGAAAS